MRRACARDANEGPIVDALRAVGASVVRLPPPSPDLLVGFRGLNLLLEVKTLRGTKRKDQEHQKRWREEWRGSVYVVTGPEEALAILGVGARRTG